MRKYARWAWLIVLVLLVVGLYHGWHVSSPKSSVDSSASLGLMLLDREQGLYVLAVTEDSPAERADIRPGDYLLQAGGMPLQAAVQLDGMIDAQTKELHLTLYRDERELQVLLPTR